MRSDIATMYSHLRKCTYQTTEVMSWAAREYSAKYSRQTRASASSTPLLALPRTLHLPSSHPPTPNTQALSLQQFPPSPLFSQLTQAPQLSPLITDEQSLALNTMAPVLYPPEANALGFLMHGSPASLSNPPSRPPSGQSLYLPGSSISRPQSRTAPSFNQRNFNIHIGRMTVAAGLPMSWTDNPEVRSVFRTFFPWAQLPSRKTLSKSILPTLQNDLRSQAQREARGSNCTLQCDGWTGINMHHLIAFMIAVWPKV